VQGLDEVGARIDGVDVEEDAVLTEPGAQMIGQPAGIGGGVFSPIADEDSWWHDGRRTYAFYGICDEQAAGTGIVLAEMAYAGPPGSSPDGP